MKYVIAILCVLAWMYGFVSFVSLEYSPLGWPETGRMFFALFGTIFSGVACVFIGGPGK